MWRIQGILLSAAAVVLAALSACAARPHSVPAHWVHDPTAVKPTSAEFSFEDLSFATKTNGWIVGNRFFLHVLGEQVEVTFKDRWAVFLTVAAPTPDEAWAGGWDVSRDEAILWHYWGRRWQAVDLSPVPVRNHVIRKLRFEAPERGWAIIGRVAAYPTGSFLYFDGTLWREVPPILRGPEPRLLDMCVTASGAGWAVGDAREPTGHMHGVVLKKEGLQWREVILPPIAPDANWTLSSVSCLSTGGMIASVVVDDKTEAVEEGFLLRYDGSWEKVPLPPAFRKYEPTRVTTVHDDEIWLQALGPSDGSVFLHQVGEQWAEVALPPLPGKGPPYKAVFINAMQFFSPDEGWAVATKFYGGGYTRGLVFRYKDGAWQTRNWNWRFWNQRWFGLLGQ